MKTQRKCSLMFFSLFLMIFFLMGAAPLVLGQVHEESEPNDSCLTAQSFDQIDLPFILEGNLDVNDVDFYRFTATPGMFIQVDLEGQATEKGTLSDPLLGFFDSDCNLIAYNDDYFSLNSRLIIRVPTDGVLILAATLFGDFSFTGDHDGQGTYQLTLEQFVPNCLISGRVVDALTVVGLSGQDYPFASVELSRCIDGWCDWVNRTTADGEGLFYFVSDYLGQLLPPGNYEVRASAEGYQAGLKVVVDVEEDGEFVDIGDLALEPLPAQFSEIRYCKSLPNEGGTCKYSVRINNRSGKQLQGAAWSIVNGWDTGSIWGDTIFQTANPIKMTLRPGASRVVNFQFDVPSSVQDGAYICANVWFGENSNQPFFNTLNNENLLCIVKGGESTGFRLLSQKEAQKLLRDQHRPPQMLQRSKKN